MLKGLILKYMNRPAESEDEPASPRVSAAEVILELHQAAQAVGRRLARRRIGDRLTATQLDTLMALLREGPLSQRALGTELSRTGGNVTMVVGNLEKRGLVVRQRLTTDKRVVTVQLTDEGRRLIEAVLPTHLQAMVAEADRLSPSEQAVLVTICRKLRSADTYRKRN